MKLLSLPILLVSALLPVLSKGVLLDGFLLDSFDETDSSIFDRLLQISKKDSVVIETCQEDATELFRGSYDRFYNGTNWLQMFYQCTCEGDFAGVFAMNCQRSNFCFDSPTPLVGVTVEVCMKHVEYNFVLDNRKSYPEMTFLTVCLDYENGLAGKLCTKYNYECVKVLREDHGRYTEDAVIVCGSQDECRPILQEVGYTKENATRLCPQRTLNDKLCKTYTSDFPEKRLDICGRTLRDESFRLTADCSNVESCAVPSCRSLSVGENRGVPVYAKCHGVELNSNMTPLAPALLLKCQGNDTMHVFDECVYQSGYLNDINIRECRECLTRTIVAKRTFDVRRNCTNFGNAICDVFLSSCTEVCGPCSLPGYNVLSCILEEEPRFRNCPLDCPPPENVGDVWLPIYKDDDPGDSSETGGMYQDEPLNSSGTGRIFAALTIAMLSILFKY